MNDKYKNLCIKINTHAEKLAALYFLANKIGCEVGNAALEYALDFNGPLGGLYVVWDLYNEKVSANDTPKNLIVVPFSDLANIDNYLAPKFVEVVLNKEHTAKVYKDKIVVGCQTFDADVIGKLGEALIKINS